MTITIFLNHQNIMKHKTSLFFVLLFCQFLFVQMMYANSVQYISPVSGSLYNNENTNIIIGFTGKINPESVKSMPVKLLGSFSGIHTFKTELVENGKKIIIKSDIPFAFGEKVTVSGIKGTDDFTFYVRNSRPVVPDNAYNEMNIGNNRNNYPFHKDLLIKPDSLPAFTIYNSGSTADGYLFISNFSASNYNSYLMILQNSGTPVHYIPLLYNAYDFKKQNDNLLTYYDEQYHWFIGMNSSYTGVDSFFCGNGYVTDIHELRVMPDGSAWLMSYDPEVVDMSQVIPGGKINAVVTGLIIQKINTLKHVVFQWRSWDHFQISDATHENFTASYIDYVHGNAIEVDNDGNILLSSRHMDEITKINSVTGEIIWRLGGKNNEFLFINDDIGFSHQHFVRRIANGHIMLFDNGNFHSPSFSRAVEYKIDEEAKSVSLEWQFRHSPDVYAFAMGSAQRLSNGNTLIGWGSATTTLTEVNPNGEVKYELSLPTGQMSYRAYRDLWGTVTSGNPVSQNTPVGYGLYQNYPNPFNPTTNIKYQLPKNSYVLLKVYDMLGKEITTLADGFQNAGEYKVQFPDNKTSFSQLHSGVYFYKLQTENFTDVRKMILVK
jgi:hypothetical protein